jgi:hypothetical protein
MYYCLWQVVTEFEEQWANKKRGSITSCAQAHEGILA